MPDKSEGQDETGTGTAGTDAAGMEEENQPSLAQAGTELPAVKSSPPAPVADLPAVDSPAPPSPAWHWCQHRNKEFHVLAGSETEAKEKFKRAVGIRGSIHPVTAVAVKNYQPTEADLELEKNLIRAAE